MNKLIKAEEEKTRDKKDKIHNTSVLEFYMKRALLLLTNRANDEETFPLRMQQVDICHDFF